MVYPYPLSSKSSSPCTNSLVTVPRVPIGITISFMFHSFFQILSKVYVQKERSLLLTFLVLCFDLLTRPKMPFEVMHRKEVTHSNGSYERKSRGRKLDDEMGRGKKKIPLYSHRLTHRKRVTSELHDSYFRSMTITQVIPKKAEVTHADRQASEEIAEAWRRVHISAWEFEGNIRPTNWDRREHRQASRVEDKQYSCKRT